MMSASPTDRPSGSPGHLRVMLVDDHELVRRGLRELLESEEDMTVVGEAGTPATTSPLSGSTRSTHRASTCTSLTTPAMPS